MKATILDTQANKFREDGLKNKEISSQFHQCYMHRFFIQKSFLAAFSSYILASVKILYEKFARKTLMKLTLGVNFTNVLWAACTLEDPKNVKIQSSHQYLFALLGSLRTKAAYKILMKLSTELSLIKLLDPFLDTKLVKIMEIGVNKRMAFDENPKIFLSKKTEKEFLQRRIIQTNFLQKINQKLYIILWRRKKEEENEIKGLVLNI